MIRFLQTPTATKKFVLGALLVFVCITMVLFLIPGIFDSIGGTSSGVYARVGDQDVTTREIEMEAQRLAQQQRLPEQYMQFVRPQAAQSLVTQAVLTSEAHRMGLTVTDQELRDELQNGFLGQMLFPNGTFIGQDRYEDFIQNQFRMSVEQFEQLLKSDLLRRKLFALIEGSINVPESEVLQEFRKQHRQVKFDYAVLTTDDMLKQIKPTDAELKAYYDSHKAEFVNSIPEKRKARFIIIDSTKLNVPPPSESELRQYYDQHKDQFNVPERVNVRHILIKTPAPGPDGKVDPKALEATQAKAEDILKQLKAGADFEALAKKYSDDPGSAKNGGNLNWIQHGATVPEFDKAAFALTQKGQLSDIVKTSYGFHIIQLVEKQPAHVRSFEDVKAEITSVVENEKKAKAADALANAVNSEAHSAGMEKAAADHQLQVTTSDYFSQNDSLPGIGSAPELMQAVFEAKPKSPPDLARTPQGYVVFELLDSKPPATPGFEEARARVEAEFKNQQAQERLNKKTQELSERAKALHDLKQAAKEEGATVKTSDLVSANGQVPDLGPMSGQASAAFDLSRGQISGPIYSGRNGAVLEMLELQEPSPAEYEKGKQLARDQILERKRNEVIGIYADSLREKMEKEGKIKYNKEELQRINSAGSSAGE